jgi:hypothetical protein
MRGPISTPPSIADDSATIGLREFGANEVADGLPINRLAGETSHDGFHHESHVLGGRGSGLTDHGIDGLGKFVSGESFGQVGFDDGYFLSFLRGELGALTLFELLDRFFPLLDHGGHDAAHFRIVEVLFQLDFLVQHSGLDHADDIHPQLIACFHGELEVFGQPIAQ